MHLPVLRKLGDGSIYQAKDLETYIADFFNLTEEERNERIPSNIQTKVRNRLNWCFYDLFRAGILERKSRGHYCITQDGRNLLAERPERIDRNLLMRFDKFREWQEASAQSNNDAITVPVVRTQAGERATDTRTPDEQIAAAYTTLRNTLAVELLERLRDMDWSKFEQLVVDLMRKMGYGGTREGSGWVTKSTGDEGVDGIINEDRLGLDVIYLQAKRYKEANIGRPKIQEFVGALAGKQANKGVFITTSSFAQTARDYANSVQQKVILIDGEELAELMIDYNLGVTVQRAYEVKRIDSDYFDGE